MVEVKPLVGEVVLVAAGALLTGEPFEDALVDEVVEARGEDVRRRADATFEVLEASGAVERLTDDEARPPVPDDGERARDR